jgi:hypothetical protein
VPIVDGIEWDTLEHHPYNGDTKSVGIFEWGFLYKEMQISDADFSKKKHPSEPTRYVVISIKKLIIIIYVSFYLT